MAPPTPREEAHLRWMKKNRGPLILLAAVLAMLAAVADLGFYLWIRHWLAVRSGVNPPGGYWHADKDGHVAGEPVLRDRCEHCYAIFHKANSMSVFTSIILMVLVSSETFYGTPPKMASVLLIVIFDLACFLAAYVFGTIIPNVV